MSLDLRSLAFGYGSRIVGSDLTLSLITGEVLALLGPNHPEYAGIKSLLDAIDAKAPAASTTGG